MQKCFKRNDYEHGVASAVWEPVGKKFKKFCDSKI